MSITIKRVYERRNEQDGTRVLVDRLWPRGLTKARAGVDLWLKDVAPSTQLRKWFGHDPSKWGQFRRRYRAELEKHPEQVALLRKAARKSAVTLVYGARDEEHNEAAVLRDSLQKKTGTVGGRSRRRASQWGK